MKTPKMKIPKHFQHPTALVETDSIGAGTRIWAFVHVLKGARIGRDCNLGDHSFIENDVRVGHRVTLKNGVAIWTGVVLEDDVFIGPSAVFTNDLFPRSPRLSQVARRYSTVGHWRVGTRVKRGASIGANATIKCGVTIGRFAMIGAGTVVTSDVPDHALVVGVPGRVRGWVCDCGTPFKLNEDHRAICGSCGEKFHERQGKVRHAR